MYNPSFRNFKRSVKSKPATSFMTLSHRCAAYRWWFYLLSEATSVTQTEDFIRGIPISRTAPRILIRFYFKWLRIKHLVLINHHISCENCGNSRSYSLVAFAYFCTKFRIFLTPQPLAVRLIFKVYSSSCPRTVFVRVSTWRKPVIKLPRT